MPQLYNPAGFWIDFPEPETYLVDVGSKSISTDVDRLRVLSDRRSVTVKYGGEAAEISDNKIQLPRDAKFLRDLAAEFIALAEQFEAARR